MSDTPTIIASESPLRDILDFTFQVNPVFKLVEQGQLSPDQRDILKALAEDQDHFGLLLSDVVPELGVLAVNRESASLFSGLIEPGRLPPQGRYLSKIAGLVLDGILQIEWNGRFVTGPAAIDCLYIQPLERLEAKTKISAMSLAALRYVQEIPTNDPRVLSSWLYRYNCLPMGPHWARRFCSLELIDEFLGLQSGGAIQAVLKEQFTAHDVPGWRAWRNFSNGHILDRDESIFKLYISPHPNFLPYVIPIIARCITNAQVPYFKMGADAFGLLRPDKLIIYFSEYGALEAVGYSLAKELVGCPAQGVPFTAALSEDGLLSWGIDPPQSEQIPGWRGSESWRVWVTDRLARGIIRAKVLEQTEMDAWQYAVTRLSLEGIDIQSWLPDKVMWRE